MKGDLTEEYAILGIIYAVKHMRLDLFGCVLVMCKSHG